MSQLQVEKLGEGGEDGEEMGGIISKGFFCSWPEAQEWVLIKHRSAAFHCCNILFNIDEMMKSQLLSIIINQNQLLKLSNTNTYITKVLCGKQLDALMMSCIV